MRIRRGHTWKIYAIRKSIAKALVAIYQNCVDEQTKKEIKDLLDRHDRTSIVADPRRCEPNLKIHHVTLAVFGIFAFGYFVVFPNRGAISALIAARMYGFRFPRSEEIKCYVVVASLIKVVLQTMLVFIKLRKEHKVEKEVAKVS